MTGREVRAALVDADWRQGSILPADLIGRIRWADENAVLPEAAQAVIISQDCDILAVSLADEPIVEVVGGVAVGSVDPNNAHAKNPRRLDVTVGLGDRNTALRLEMRWRGSLPRDRLRDSRPAASLKGDDLRALVAWTTRRYERAALPDAFNERIRVGKQFDKLRNTLKRAKGTQPLGVFVALGDQKRQELPAGEPYRVILVVVLQGELAAGSTEWDRFEKEVYEPFVEQFRSVEGIKVMEDQLVSEHAIPWRERRVHLTALDLDDISLRYESETPYDR